MIDKVQFTTSSSTSRIWLSTFSVWLLSYDPCCLSWWVVGNPLHIANQTWGCRQCLEGWRSIPSGKRLHNYGKSPCFMGKSTISMAIFNSKLYVYQRVTPSYFGVHQAFDCPMVVNLHVFAEVVASTWKRISAETWTAGSQDSCGSSHSGKTCRQKVLESGHVFNLDLLT